MGIQYSSLSYTPILSLQKISRDSMSYGALHFSGQQNSPSFRQFSMSAPQHLPQLCTTQQKPREAESWASVAYHAMLGTPVMSQYLWKQGQKKIQTLSWQGHLKYSVNEASRKFN